MTDRLSSFLIEIECPSGAKLVGDLHKVAAMVAAYAAPTELSRESTNAAAHIYSQIENVESNIFAYIWTIPFKELLSVMRGKNVGPSGLAGDQQAWTTTVEAMAADQLHDANPFLIRIIPKIEGLNAEPVGDGATFTAGEIGDILEGLARIAYLADNMGAGLGHDVVDYNRTKIMSLSEDLKKAIYVKATSQKLPAAPAFPDPQGRIILIACPDPNHTDTHPSCRLNTQTGDYSCLACGAQGKLRDGSFYATRDGRTMENAGDGWGHAHTADTVEALLREGTAMLEGTDKHEQMFKDMDDKVKMESLVKLVTSLQESRTAQIKANQLHDQQIKALEQGMTHLQGEYMALLKSTQKLHRRLGVPMGAYMTETDSLRAKAAEMQKLIAFAKQVEASPVLRAIFSL